MMRTIETTGVVNADHSITLKLPDDFPEGECQVVVSTEAIPSVQRPTRRINWASLPPLDLVMIDPNETFRREELYGNDGR